MRIAFLAPEKKILLSTAKMERRSGRKYNASSGRGVASSEIDVHSILSVQKNGSCKTNSRLLKQLQMDLCVKQIVPRAHLHALIENRNDEQYSLRHRVSEPSIATKQHVNKRKSKGQVRLFGNCDLNPNLLKKSTPPFFHEERLKSPIHKLIEINKKAMLAFQEPPNEPVATTTCCVGNIDNITFNRDKSQKDAIRRSASVVVKTVTLMSDDDSINGSIDYDDKIVAYKMCQDVNMNENITIISAASAEEILDDSADVMIVEPMDYEDSRHKEDDDVQQVREMIGEIEPQEEEKAEDEVESQKAEALWNVEEVEREENGIGIQQDHLEIIDLVEQSDSMDFEEAATIHMELPEYLSTETDCEIVAAPIETDSEIVAAPTESDDEMVAAPTESDGEMVDEATENESEIIATPNDTGSEIAAAPTEDGSEIETALIENDSEIVATPIENDSEIVATPTENGSEIEAAPTENDSETVATPSATNLLGEEYLDSHRVGQLVWAQLAKFPFWPAIVCLDKNKISVKDKEVHVMFLADHRRTAWIRAPKSLLPYKGLQQYERFREEVLTNKETKKSDLKNARISFKIAPSRAWTLAVAEGDVLSFVTVEHRLDFYKEILTDKSKQENPNDDTISISSESSMSDLGKSSSPCTFDTAYSSMKRSSSSSIASHSTTSSPNRMFHEYGDENMQQSCQNKISPAKRIECYLRSVAQNQVTKNIDGSLIDYAAPSSPSIVYDDTASEASRAKNMHDLIFRKFKENIVIEDKDFEFIEAISKLRLLETSKPKSITKRKRNDPSDANESAKRRKVEPEKGTARTKARAAQSLAPPKPLTPHTPTQDPEAARMLREKKEQDKKDLLQKKKAKFFDYVMQKNPANYLFKNVPKSAVCQICMKPGNVRICTGKCGGFFHFECLAKVRSSDAGDWYATYLNQLCDDTITVDLVTGEDFVAPSNLRCKMSPTNNNSERFECAVCLCEREPECFVCYNSATIDDDLIECSRKGCGCYYHAKCLKYWPQHKKSYVGDKAKSLNCPRHVCQICIADNPKRNYLPNIENDQKLIKCLLCPATYHRTSACIPAGSEILSQSQLVCPRHRKTIKKPVNTDWCFLCTKGGTLICCETCPTAFHLECLNIDEPDDKYICEDCESGRLPLYGEIVWIKYSYCKWWPGMLVDPSNVPEKVADHKPGQNYMCVRFFGTYDFGWVCQGYVYLFQMEDRSFGKMEGKDKRLSVATEEASTLIKTINEKHKRKVLRNRPRYIKIKINRPVPPVKFEIDEEFEEVECKCSSTDKFPCGPDNNCQNYSMSIECNANCTAGINCLNQRFANRNYPDVQLKHFESKGWGLVTLQHIKRDTFIIEYVGEVIDSEEFHRRFEQSVKDKEENFYFLKLDNGLYIDSGIRGNEARFINHSCEPNCNPQKWTVNGQTRIGLFAASDIPTNTELTFNYNWSTIGIQKCACYCGTPSCSGFIGFKSKNNKK